MKFMARRCIGVGFSAVIVFGILLFGYGAVHTFIYKNYNICLLMSFFMLFEIFGCIYELKKQGRELFSTLQFDEQGIRNRLIWRKEIFIPWDECVDIGIGLFTTTQYNRVRCFYFSKILLTEEQMQELATLRLNDTHLWVHYRRKVLTELTKYIDESKIKDLELLDKKRKIQR